MKRILISILKNTKANFKMFHLTIKKQ